MIYKKVNPIGIDVPIQYSHTPAIPLPEPTRQEWQHIPSTIDTWIIQIAQSDKDGKENN